MIAYKNIKNLHLEISTACNARCPECTRNARGYPHNFGYPEVSMPLETFRSIFSYDFIQQLESVDFCGNFGDFIANPEAADMVEILLKYNKKLQIFISTNGSARNQAFWKKLASWGKQVQISFCIDGLEDTHPLYRVDTNWNTIIRNAKTFIDAGGYAIWKMIKFKHNEHQIEQCKALATELGFDRFDLTDHGRDFGPVYNRDGTVSHMLGGAESTESNALESIIQWHNNGSIELPEEKQHLDCYSNKAKSIYLAADGSVYPCCYLGSFPATFASGAWYQQTNAQLKQLLAGFNNNAPQVGLETAIEWFNKIEQAWAIEKYKDGRIILCDSHCGQKYQHWDRVYIKE